MSSASRNVLAVAVSGLWINASEFFRNEVLLSHYWTQHYQSMGLTFPAAPINGMVWVAWGFLFALAIHVVSRKFSLLHTVLLCWLVGFVLMWLVLWNTLVLPNGLLVAAVPLSALEVAVAAFLCRKLAPVAA